MDKVLVIHSDGGARGNPGPGACSFIVERDGQTIGKGSKYLGKVTNNFAEYSGVLLALDWVVKNLPIKQSTNQPTYFYLDSELVAKQLSGLYKIKNVTLRKMAEEIRKIIFENSLQIKFIHVLRHKNKIADGMVNEELDKALSGKVV